MPTYQFEAMDAKGEEIKDVIEAASQDDAQATIRQMGYFVTKIAVQKGEAATAGKKKAGKTFVIGGVSGKIKTLFTRQLSILQDAGLPILRSLRILEQQAAPGALKNSLIDVIEEIESGSTLSEAMAKSPKVFDRLYVNMIRAGEAGGALEIILRRLAEFMERAQTLKKTVQGAMIYPVVVVLVAVGILTFIMIGIVPTFNKMFQDFELELPLATTILIKTSEKMLTLVWFIPLVPVALFIFVKLVTRFKPGRMGFHQFLLQLPVIGKLIEKNILARTTRTLGTLVSSGVPILEALTITRETSNNAVFERMYARVTDAIREGETINKPMRIHSYYGFHPVALFFWGMMCVWPLVVLPGIYWDPFVFQVAGVMTILQMMMWGFWYRRKTQSRIVDELVVNMVGVGEETGELDTMLYKVADYYDEEVRTLTDGMMKLIEPMLIVFLGGAVGFIVISLFMPLVSLITGLS
ncbi:type II secretion system F family protein [Lignipirellula cremea]|uniref:Type II secretion system protein F n=1 Tax=Lignipirellula cremea TaxID=2528010 RepID=A0A518DMG5_9BACT|nr:type II secretion system F family protein [Lignipirellula cremea]QDU93034.1 Putative type II secretion system protein F [Lignipirellula cremea]